MIRLGESFVKPDGTVARIVRITCLDHGAVLCARLVLDTNTSGRASIDFACCHCQRGALVQCVACARESGTVEYDPISEAPL